jgi:hypothetical protein
MTDALLTPLPAGPSARGACNGNFAVPGIISSCACPVILGSIGGRTSVNFIAPRFRCSQEHNKLLDTPQYYLKLLDIIPYITYNDHNNEY